MGRTGWVAVRAGGRCQPRGTQQGPRAESHWNHLMGRGGELQQERPVGDTRTNHTGRPGALASPWGRRAPQTHLSHPPPCPQGAPSLGGPSGSRCCQPHQPPGAAPHGGPPPAGAASASSPCLPASCPSWGQEGTRGGSGQGRRRTRRPCRGWQRPGQPSLGPGPRGQDRGEVGKTSGPPGWRGPLTWSGAGAQAPARGIGP